MSDSPVDPYLILADIEVRCRLGSAPLPRQEDLANYWSGVVFMLNGEQFVAPLSEVSEIMHIPMLTKVPGARAWLKGIANVRGMLVPVADLQLFFGRRQSTGKRQRILVINGEQSPVGVVVDDVIGLQHFEHGQRVEGEVQVEEVIRPFVLGAFAHEDKIWPVFSPQTLTRHASFKQVSL